MQDAQDGKARMPYSQKLGHPTVVILQDAQDAVLSLVLPHSTLLQFMKSCPDSNFSSKGANRTVNAVVVLNTASVSR